MPPTENRGRTHTSIISVILLQKPKFGDIQINPDEVRITYFKSPGCGGQRKNKVMSATRLQYKGLVVEASENREQFKNKEAAFQRLRELVKQEAMLKAEQAMREEIVRQNPGCGHRGDYERNYNQKRNEISQGDRKTTWDAFFRGDFSSLYEE